MIKLSAEEPEEVKRENFDAKDYSTNKILESSLSNIMSPKIGHEHQGKTLSSRS